MNQIHTSVVWTTAAANLLAAFCRRHEPPLLVNETREGIDKTLRHALPDDPELIVLRMYFGFRVRENEYVLLIDTGHGSAIAKLGEPAKLRHEHAALRSATLWHRFTEAAGYLLRHHLAVFATGPI